MPRIPCLKTWMLLALVVHLASGCAQPIPIHHRSFDNDYVTRIGIRPKAKKLTSTNYLGRLATIQAGQPAKITMFSAIQVHLNINNTPYVMYPHMGEFATDEEGVVNFIDKYFVESLDDLRMDAIEPEATKQDVMAGRPVIGMTKEQIYTAVGPPAFIDETRATLKLSREELMKSDLWTYPNQWVLFLPTTKVFYFADSKLQRVKS